MELRADVHFAFPPQVVFLAFRDDMAKLLPYLPSVSSIEIASRKQNGPLVENVIEWRGGGGIPAPLRAVLVGSVLSWTDYATWNADELCCDWRTETHAFTETVRCGAHDRFLEDGPGKTLLEIRGTIEVDAKRIRGVPGFLAGKVGRTMEDFLGSRIQANLIETSKGLSKYLEERGGGA
jgi:hypothetical protein